MEKNNEILGKGLDSYTFAPEQEQTEFSKFPRLSKRHDEALNNLQPLLRRQFRNKDIGVNQELLQISVHS